MKLYSVLLVALVIGGIAAPLMAQEGDVDITGTLRFRSPGVTQVQTLFFGVGDKYTDSTDREYEEFIPPFPPPGGFLVVLDRACSSGDGDPPCYWKQDYRGLPDSIAEIETPQFSIDYDIQIVNNSTGKGLILTMLAPDWPQNVDSIHFVDVQLPRAFEHTLTGPAVIEITDEFTTYIKMTVYYNLEVSTVEEATDAGIAESALQVAPNPANGNEIAVRSIFQAGDRVAVADMLGRVIVETEAAKGEREIRIGTAALPSGNYMVMRLKATGEVIGQELLRIVR